MPFRTDEEEALLMDNEKATKKGKDDTAMDLQDEMTPQQKEESEELNSSQTALNSSSHLERNSFPHPSEHEILMAQYASFFEERGISMQEVFQEVQQRSASTSQQDSMRSHRSKKQKRKGRKLGIGRPRLPPKSKEVLKEESIAERRKKGRDEILYGPNRLVYAPHLDTMYAAPTLEDDEWSS